MRSAHLAQDYIPSSKLAIIGDGPIEIREKLDSLIENLGLGQNIIRFGWMSNDKYVVMKQSKFFIFPSFSDAFALSVCEAMACQLPVISYDLPQFREHYGKGIIRVEKGNVEKLAQAVRMLLGNRDMLEKLGFDAFEQSKEYNLDKAAKEELQIIMEKFPV